MSLLTDNKRGVAVVGMSITIPGHSNGLDPNGKEVPNSATGILDLQGFSDFLENGGISHGPAPHDRSPAAVSSSGKFWKEAKPGSYFPKLPTYDPEELGLTREEADEYTPSANLLVREASSALFDSGIRYRKCRVGVFVSASGCIECAWAPSVAKWISAALELTGPSIGVNADESTSSAAMYKAIQSIREGECDSAIVGAANLVSFKDEVAELIDRGILSPDVSYPFTGITNESGPGDVVVAVVIKCLERAINDCDRIYSTILGSELIDPNEVGRTSGPDRKDLSSAAVGAYTDAGVLISQTGFLEICGEATLNGEKAEIVSMNALAGFRRYPLIFGCVKSNVGHCGSGAFLTSLVKCSLMLYKKVIFPDGFLSQTAFDTNESGTYRFESSFKAKKFITNDGVETASISDYSARGVCAHFVLTSYENTKRELNTVDKPGPYLFLAAGMSAESVKYRIDAYPRMYKGFDQRNVASSISQRAKQLTWRSFGVGDNLSGISFTSPVQTPKKNRIPILAIFSGQGPQAACMGRSLFTRYSVFRDSIMKSDEILNRYAGFSFVQKTMLFRSDSPPGLSKWPWPTVVNTMAIIFFQVALCDLMRTFGLEPDIIIGYSMGEVAAMYASGALTQEAVIQLIWESGESFLVADGRGTIAAVGCSAQVANEILTRVNQENPLTAKLGLSCFSSPYAVSVAGYSLGITKFLSAIAYRQIPHVELKVRAAVHSPFLDSCKEGYVEKLSGIFAKQEGNLLPRIPVISTVTGKLVVDPYTPNYIWRNLRQPVRFSDAVRNALERYPDLVCIELAPNPVLGRQLKEIGVKQVFPTLRKSETPEMEIKLFFENLGDMIAGGVDCLNVSKINGSSVDEKLLLDIPCPLKPTIQEPPTQTATKSHPWGLTPLIPGGFQIDASVLTRGPEQHVITNGQDVVACAAYVELAMGQSGICGLRDVRFLKRCTIYSNASHPFALPSILCITLEQNGNKLLMHSSSSSIIKFTDFGTINKDKLQPYNYRMQDPFRELHFMAEIERKVNLRGITTKVNIHEVLARCDYEIAGAKIYQRWDSIRQYKDNFRRIRWMWSNKKEAITEINGDLDSPKEYLFNPLLAESIFQIVLGFGINERVHGPTRKNILQVHSIDRCFRNDGLHKPLVLPGVFRVYSKKIEWSPYHAKFNYYILGSQGEVLFTFLGIHYRSTQLDDQSLLVENRFHLISTRCDYPVTSKEANIVLPASSTALSDCCFLRLLDHCAINCAKRLVFGDGTDMVPFKEQLSGATTARRKFISWCINVSSKSSLPMSSIVDRLSLRGQGFIPFLKAICDTQKEVALDPTKAEELLFNETSLEQVWNEIPFRGGVFARTVEEFKTVIKSYGSSKIIRVLELNAGHGCLTRALGNAVGEAVLEIPGLQIEYYCADLDLGLAKRSARTSTWQPVSPVRVAFDGSTDLQGNLKVDIVVGLNALHTFPSLKIGLLFVESILLPGGCLMLVEVDRRVPESTTPGMIWLDFIFGGLKGWFDSPYPNNEDAAVACGRESTRAIFKGLGYLDPWFIEIERPKHLGFRTLITRIPRLSDNRALDYTHAQPQPKVLTAIPEVAAREDAPVTMGEIEVSEARQWVDSYAYHYHFGEDAAMMEFLYSLDPRTSIKLVLYTTAGGKTSNSLIGITRTLRQEFPIWDIQLIIFDQYPEGTQPRDYLFNNLPFLGHSASGGLYIKENSSCKATELRILGGIDRKSLLGQCPYAWKENHEPWAHYPPPVGEYDVEVQVLSLQKPDSQKSAFGFSGTILQKGRGALIPTGIPVVGVSLDGPMASRLVCHWEQITKLPPGFQFQFGATAVRSMVTCNLVIEKLPSLIGYGKHIIIHGGPPGLRLETAICLGRILYHRGWVVHFTSDAVDDIPFDAASFRYSTTDPNFIRKVKNHTFGKELGCMISFTEDNRLLSLGLEILLESPADIIVVPEEGTLYSVLSLPGQKPNQKFTFINPETSIRRDYYSVRDAISRFTGSDDYPISVWDHRANLVALELTETEPKGPVLRAGVVVGTPAFNPRATYVIVEGVCWIGFAMAKFIIENGGLHVVVTYRSGQNVMETSPHGRERLLFNNLRRLPNVTVRVVCAETENISSMRTLFDNQKPPVAGVISFAPTNRDTETGIRPQTAWNSVYSVRATSASILLDSLYVSELDWMVFCSPFSTIIGQSGQPDISGAQAIVSSIITRFKNCTNVVIPPIIDRDPCLFPETGGEMADARQNYTSFGMKTADICKHILDAIWCMPKSHLYIPDVNLAGLTGGGISENAKWLANDIETSKVVLPDPLPGVVEIVSQTLGIPQVEIDLDLELRKVGIDAFQAINLSRRLESNIGLRVPALKLFAPGSTVRKLLEENGCSGTKEHTTSLTQSSIDQEPISEPISKPISELDNKDIAMKRNSIAHGTPIFIILPPTIPISSSFTSLASALPFPAFILPCPGLTSDSSIDMLSKYYLHSILNTLEGSRSSLHLISFSDSSAVILSLAEKLLNCQHTIESLVFIEGSPALIYLRSFNSFMNDRISTNYWQDLVLENLETVATLDPSFGSISDILQQASEFLDGNITKENKWCFEYLDTYIKYATLLHKASTVVPKCSHEKAWKFVAKSVQKAFLAKAKRGIVTESWFGNDEIDESWGIPAALNPIVREYDCGHCGILLKPSGLVESLWRFWGVERVSESGVDESGVDENGVDESGVDESGVDMSGVDESGVDENGRDCDGI